MYCLTVIDKFTRWPEAVPSTNITAETVNKAFVVNWIVRFGVAAKVTTDLGRQFESELFHQLAATLGIDHSKTTPNHPQANGQIERVHHQLKATIIGCHDRNRWIDALPIVLHGTRDRSIKGTERIYWVRNEIVITTLNEQPPGFIIEGQENKVCRSKKIFYD